MADDKTKSYAPVDFGIMAPENDGLVRRYIRLRQQIKGLEALLDDVKDEILSRAWRDELAETLKAGGFDGVELKDCGGVTRMHLSVTYPVRFQGKELERDDPQLYAKYKRQSDKPVVRMVVTE